MSGFNDQRCLDKTKAFFFGQARPERGPKILLRVPAEERRRFLAARRRPAVIVHGLETVRGTGELGPA